MKKTTISDNLSPKGLSRRLPACAMALFGIVSFIILIAGHSEYLRRLELLSLFMSGKDFLAECMSVPGGFIDWISAFFNQLFYYPAAGSLLFTLFLILLWILTAKATGLKGLSVLTAGVVPAMLFLFPLLPGYEVFTVKTDAFAWTGIFGFGASLLILWAFRNSRYPATDLAVVVAALALYPPLGFYALFGLLLCVIEGIVLRRKWWVLVVAAVGVAVWPQICFYCFESHTMASRIYLSGLPRMGENPGNLMTPYWIAIGWIALLTATGMKLETLRNKKSFPLCTSAVFLLSLGAMIILPYRDPNFSATNRITLALEERDYEKALEAARDLDERPTRLNNLLTHAALNHLGATGDRLFTFPISDNPYNTRFPGNALREAGARPVYYHFGRVYDAYRWGMEDMVEYGPRVEYLDLMARCALLTGDLPLARRYASMLQKTAFHKERARTYLRYADNPAEMDNDPEFSTIRPYMAFNNSLGGDNAMIETYLSQSIAALEGGPAPLVELSMQYNLIRKSIENFWPRFILYARNHQRIPRHYQEAAILFSTLENRIDWHQFNIDPDVQQRFNTFMEMAQRNSANPEAVNAELFLPLFGDTYWYYYFFVNNLKTT